MIGRSARRATVRQTSEIAVARAPRSLINSAAETTIRSRGLRISSSTRLCMMLYIIGGHAKEQSPFGMWN